MAKLIFLSSLTDIFTHPLSPAEESPERQKMCFLTRNRRTYSHDSTPSIKPTKLVKIQAVPCHEHWHQPCRGKFLIFGEGSVVPLQPALICFHQLLAAGSVERPGARAAWPGPLVAGGMPVVQWHRRLLPGRAAAPQAKQNQQPPSCTPYT